MLYVNNERHDMVKIKTHGMCARCLMSVCGFLNHIKVGLPLVGNKKENLMLD